MKHFSDLLLIILLGGMFLLLSAANFIKPAADYSYTERRALSKKPSLSIESLTDGQYMARAEAFVNDQFPLRDDFRKLKADLTQNVLMKKDNNGCFYAGGHLSKLEFRVIPEKWDRSISVLQDVSDRYLKGTKCRSWFCLIPDKNTYLSPAYHYPVWDFPALEKSASEALYFHAPVSIADTLSIDSYYRTDPHWKQEKLIRTVERLAEAMDVQLSQDFTENVLEKPFYGAYAGQSLLETVPDTIVYLTNDALDNAVVTSFDTGNARPAKVYDLDKASGRDPYEIFLSGSDALIVIDNPLSENDRELVIFRDSFGSAIAPLLLSGYSKISLVDLRYLSSDSLAKYIQFTDQDVLFLYSAMMLNSGTIR